MVLVPPFFMLGQLLMGHFLKKNICNYLNCVHVYLGMFTSVQVLTEATGVSDPLELELKISVSYLAWVLEIKLWSSAGVANANNNGAISHESLVLCWKHYFSFFCLFVCLFVFQPLLWFIKNYIIWLVAFVIK